MNGFLFVDPGPCPICGAPHSCCVELPSGAIAIDQLPASSAHAAALRATAVQAALPPGEVTTGTYRGDTPRRRRAR